MKKKLIVLLSLGFLVFFVSSVASASAMVNPLLVQPEIMEKSDANNKVSSEGEEQAFKTESNYSSCVLLDDDLFSVSLLDVVYDTENGWGISVRCENKSEDELSFSWKNIMITGDDDVSLWEENTVVHAGKLRQYGILTSEAEEAELFQISISVTKEKEILDTASALIRPAYGEVYILDDDSSPVVVDFDGLLERNNEVCGWIYSPNTVISYPVVQTENNSKYLHKDIDLTYSSYGMIFVETNSRPSFNNDNNILYGHHMNDGSMFASIVNYSKQNYYEKHPKLYLNTPQINYRVDIFAAFLTDMYSSVYMPNFPNNEEMQEWLDTAIEQSAIETDVSVAPGDKILTMSTCTYEYDTARYVVLGKMTPIL